MFFLHLWKLQLTIFIESTLRQVFVYKSYFFLTSIVLFSQVDVINKILKSMIFNLFELMEYFHNVKQMHYSMIFNRSYYKISAFCVVFFLKFTYVN